MSSCTKQGQTRGREARSLSSACFTIFTSLRSQRCNYKRWTYSTNVSATRPGRRKGMRALRQKVTLVDEAVPEASRSCIHRISTAANVDARTAASVLRSWR